MNDLRPVLEHLRDELTPPPDAFERFVERRRRKHRRQRAAAATLALALGVGSLLVVGRAFNVGGRGSAGEPVSPSPSITFIRNGDLWTINPDGTEEAKVPLGVPGRVNGVAWAPDGTRMAVSVEVTQGTEGARFHLYVVSMDGGDPRRLTEGASDRFPAWSSDGSRIAFTRDLSEGNGDQEIFVIGADGSGETQLTDTNGANLQPTWSPDGTRIAFASTRDGVGDSEIDEDSEIYVMNADGSEQRRLTRQPGWDAAPAWSSDGRVAYTAEGPAAGIYTVDPEGGAPKLLLADPDPFNLFIAWSPDARSLAVASRRDADPSLFVLDVGTGEFSRIAEGDLLWGATWRPF